MIDLKDEWQIRGKRWGEKHFCSRYQFGILMQHGKYKGIKSLMWLQYSTKESRV